MRGLCHPPMKQCDGRDPDATERCSQAHHHLFCFPRQCGCREKTLPENPQDSSPVSPQHVEQTHMHDQHSRSQSLFPRARSRKRWWSAWGRRQERRGRLITGRAPSRRREKCAELLRWSQGATSLIRCVLRNGALLPATWTRDCRAAKAEHREWGRAGQTRTLWMEGMRRGLQPGFWVESAGPAEGLDDRNEGKARPR